MTELKPCPFCGGKVTIALYDNWWSIIASGNEPNVSCGCRLFMESELFDENDIWAKQRQKEKLIEKWNNRPNPWHTGTPDGDGWPEPSVYVIKFDGQYNRYFHRHLFKPDFTNKCFRSISDKSIKFPFDMDTLFWHKVDLYSGTGEEK